MKQPVVERLSSQSPLQSASFSSVRLKTLSVEYTKLWLVGSKEHVCQPNSRSLPPCPSKVKSLSLIELFFGLLGFAVYKRAPTRPLYSVSSPNCSTSVALTNLRLFSAGVLDELLSCVLNFSMTHSRHVSWSQVIVSEPSLACVFRSHSSFPFRPSKKTVSKVFFKSSMSCELVSVMTRSSVQLRTKSLLSFSFLLKRQWSFLLRTKL